MQKIKVTFEHADGKTETLRMSLPIALASINRFLEPGWPFLTPIYEGKRLKAKDGNTSNAFITTDNQRVVI